MYGSIKKINMMKCQSMTRLLLIINKSICLQKKAFKTSEILTVLTILNHRTLCNNIKTNGLSGYQHI